MILGNFVKGKGRQENVFKNLRRNGRKETKFEISIH